MDDSSLLSQLGGSSSSAGDTLQSIQGAIQAAFWIGLVLSVILTIVFIIYAIYKMRVQSAILRIDKNLQKLVDFQVPAVEQVEEPQQTQKSEENTDEQK
jgi:uncharacterized membrane protein